MNALVGKKAKAYFAVTGFLFRLLLMRRAYAKQAGGQNGGDFGRAFFGAHGVWIR